MIFVVPLVLLALAWLLNLGLLVYAAWVLTGLLFISHWLSSGWIASLAARRTMETTHAEIGDQVAVTIEVENRGRRGVSWVLIEDVVPQGAEGLRGQPLEITGRRLDIADLRPGGRLRLLYQIQCNRRGYYQTGPLVAETGDLFGLSRRYRVLREPDFLLVYPRVVTLEGYDIASRRPIGEVRLTHRLFEDPTRIAGVRDYWRGDPLSRIHWKATARTGTLQSKLYEASTVAGATVVVDLHQESYTSADEPFRSELAITCAASIAHSVHQMGQQVGLVTNGRDAADRFRVEGWKGDRRTRDEARQSASMSRTSDRIQPVVVPTRKSDTQFSRILETLARLEKSDGLRLLDLLAESRDQIPRDASLIAIVGRVTLETGVALGTLRRQGLAVTAIVNCYDVESYARWSSVLLAEGIDTRHLRDEESIRAICQRQVLLR
jgi:uncharacterized repeat protein (TIGR01451 family)